MNLSPRNSVSPIKKPKVSFKYHNTPIKTRNDKEKQNIINQSSFYRHPISPNIVKQQIIVQKKKILRQRLKTSSDQIYCICGKPLNLTGQNIKNNYCWQCINKQIKKGQVCRQTFSPKQNKVKILNSDIQKRSKRQFNILQFLKEVENQKQQLKRQKQQSFNNDIRITYKNKKQELKNHYERIKISIKKSIEEDLKALQQQENKQIEKLENRKQKLLQNICNLQQIQRQIKQKNTECLGQFSQIMKMKKNRQTLQSYQQSRTKTSQFGDIKDQITFLYQPQTYRMVKRENNLVLFSQQKDVLFSFQKRY